MKKVCKRGAVQVGYRSLHHASAASMEGGAKRLLADWRTDQIITLIKNKPHSCYWKKELKPERDRKLNLEPRDLGLELEITCVNVCFNI